ncbi:hypothetical protein AXG93_1160s1180 [Marchantia polymorpha subsp. ruderalis]|uniref:Uncharacterized protein n=1 Tax=Marchantia polymorpha subsp. ruderalis TaxID=1480154 RepID=A0A176VN64_MARPO|nr:hypothetical protein AXG93_1160s1180 [Marchantia polymorpha subsp. ruderalis]
MGVLAGAHVGGVIAELAVTSSSGEWKLDGASPHVKVSYKRTCSVNNRDKVLCPAPFAFPELVIPDSWPLQHSKAQVKD